jgi:predicted phage terminase large subunit-like protein
VIGTLRAPRDGSPPGHYVLEAWRGKLEFAALKRKVVKLHSTWRCHAVLVEDAASGQSLIQELRSGTTLPMKPIKPDRDKYERVTAITPVLEDRRLLLPETAWWREEFIAELTSFPNGAHDDWCDALAMALNYLREDNHAEKWITADKLRIAARYYAEGLPVDKAAAKLGLSTEQLQDYIDRYPPTLIFESGIKSPDRAEAIMLAFGGRSQSGFEECMRQLNQSESAADPADELEARRNPEDAPLPLREGRHLFCDSGKACAMRLRILQIWSWPCKRSFTHERARKTREDSR